MLDQRTGLPDIDTSTERNDIMGLRNMLFSEIRALDGKVTKERAEVAKIKCDLAQTIINSVKVEIGYRQVQKSIGNSNLSGFIPETKLVEGEVKPEAE